MYVFAVYVFAVCVFVVIRKRHPGVIGTQINRDPEGSESHSQEIQNYTNGGETRENIPFEIKKMIDSKGMDSEGMEGKPRKIFGSNSKVFISNGQTYTFQTLYSQKYSVQIQKF